MAKGNFTLGQDHILSLGYYDRGQLDLTSLSDILKDSGIRIARIAPAIGTGGLYEIELVRGICRCVWQQTQS